MTQPTVSKHWRTTVGQSPGIGPIPPDHALYKVRWSKYNFKKHLHGTIKSEDTEVLGGLRARPNEIKARSSRPTWKNCSLWLCNVHCWNGTQYYSRDSSVNIPLPPDQHHCSDEAKWRIGGLLLSLTHCSYGGCLNTKNSGFPLVFDRLSDWLTDW